MSAPRLSPTLTDLLGVAWSTLKRQILTALPGIIESYDPETCKASVLPSILELAGDGTTMPNKIISNVPVIWPGSSQGSIRFPLDKGDGVLLVFSCRSTDEWRGSGNVVNPADIRTHDLNDCHAIPGLFSFNKVKPTPNNTDCFINFKDQSVIIRANGDIELGTGGSLKALVNEAFLTFFDTHTHPVPTLGVSSVPSVLTTAAPGAYQTGKTTAL